MLVSGSAHHDPFFPPWTFVDGAGFPVVEIAMECTISAVVSQ